MKKMAILVLVYFVVTAFALVIISKGGEKMYLLNWGEYIDPLLIEEFEEKNNVTVIMEEVGSSEEMHQKINTGATNYDIAIPGDYIIEKLYKDKLIKEIDFTKLKNYKEDMFSDDLEVLRNDFFEGNEKVSVPYFWGAYSIIYSNLKPGVKEAVEKHGFNIFFNRSLTPSGTKIGMYNIPRFAVTCYLLNNNIDINTTDFDKDNLGDKITSAVKAQNYNQWGDDLLKKQVSVGNLDVAFVQLGDFFDQYYITEADGDEVTFSCFIPQNTAAFFDGMVIPKTSKNTEMAHKFIDFFLDTEVAYLNASYVGYSPAIKSVISTIEEDEDFDEMLLKYPFYTNPFGGRSGSLFRDLGSTYSTRVEKIINSAKG